MSKVIIYDFDGTLTPTSIPKFEILEKCGMKDSLMDSIIRSKETNTDLYVAVYKSYLDVIKESGNSLINSNFCLGNDKVIYNKGVEEFLKTVIDNGSCNYLLSSGIKVYLEGISIASCFEEIYGTTFNYDENNEVVGVDLLMTDKKKVEKIKDINKIRGNNELDCTDIIYIGDGLTDFYAMEYVKNNGGISILVFQDELSKSTNEMFHKGVVSRIFKADYSSNSDLSVYIKNICK